MKKNYPMAIVGFILLILSDYLIMSAVLNAIGWLCGITIELKVVAAAGFALLVLQLLIV